MEKQPLKRTGRQNMMRRILKYLFYLVVLGALVVILYAYVGPHIGEDFSRPQEEIRERIILNGE